MGQFNIGPASAVAVVVAFGLSACSTMRSLPSFDNNSSAPTQAAAPPPDIAPEIPASIRATEVIGRWGYASFHRPEDRVRTEAVATSQCAHPFVIGQGPSGGVMMYPPDQAQMREFWLKGGPAGKNYIGPHGEGGVAEDREVIFLDGRVMVLRYVNADVASRYGTGVYVRCAPTA
jgi:hypothetical protein